jgi:hypothetical protein
MEQNSGSFHLREEVEIFKFSRKAEEKDNEVKGILESLSTCSRAMEGTMNLLNTKFMHPVIH